MTDAQGDSKKIVGVACSTMFLIILVKFRLLTVEGDRYLNGATLGRSSAGKPVLRLQIQESRM